MPAAPVAVCLALVAALTALEPVTAAEPTRGPRVCWQETDAAAAFGAGAGPPLAGRLAIGDGAHPPLSIPWPPAADARTAERPLLIVRGSDPQLFLRWPTGRLLWIWARHRPAGLRRLEARLVTTTSAACISTESGAGPALQVTATSEDQSSTCLTWPLAATAAPAGRARCAPVAVPDLVGRPLAEAQEILDSFDLTVGALAERPSTEEATVVLEQQPPPGAGRALATGDGVDLVIAGQRLVRVPDITGRKVAAATAVVAPLELDLVARSAGKRIETARIGGYEIDEQSPAAGELAATGSEIEIAVSLRLPDLREAPVATALRLLGEQGLRPAWGGFELPGDPQAQEPYRVGVHRPGPGEPASWGQQIELEVVVEVPQLRGLRPAAARTLLAARSLELERATPAVADVAAERIRRQRPAAGDSLAPGAPVLTEIGVLTPDIGEETVARAEERLAARGLRLELPEPASAAGWESSTEPHRLQRQRPRAGSLVAAGSAITADLEVQMPNLLWQSAANADARLRRLGLKPGRPIPRTPLSLRQRVASQSPAPGTWLTAGAAVQLALGPGLAPPPPDPRWPWLWLAIVAALAGVLLRPRLRKRPRGVRVEGHTDFGTQKLTAPAGGAGPPAVRLLARWDPGRQTIEISPGGAPDAST